MYDNMSLAPTPLDCGALHRHVAFIMRFIMQFITQSPAVIRHALRKLWGRLPVLPASPLLLKGRAEPPDGRAQ